MFDKHLSVEMLDYEKLFEDVSVQNDKLEESGLSSIKEERESKEEQYQSIKKVENNKGNKGDVAKQKSSTLNSPISPQ